MAIRIGIKLWSTNIDFLNEIKPFIDQEALFIELTYIPGTSIDPFLDIDAPFTIHIPNSNHGFNIANRSEMEENLEIVEDSVEWANRLDAEYLVLHPGYGSFNDSKLFLDRIDDDRILIENMPKTGLNGQKMIGYTPDQIKALKADKFGFCLDLNHAIKASISMNISYKDLVEDFFDLDPDLIHISNGKLDEEKDEHLSITEGDYDWNYLLSTLKRFNQNYITLETPHKTIKNDIKKIKKIINDK